MPVHIMPSEHGPNAIYGRFASTALEVLHRSCPYTLDQPFEILQTSLNSTLQPSTLQASSNGFIDSLVRAYSHHHHLRIRPEDVWLAILTQFSFFVVAHAEELRSLFVAHEGKKVLKVSYNHGNQWTVDFGHFASEIARLIQENVLDPDLRDWMMPGFSTSTRHDDVVASIVMMGTVQKYFEYEMFIECGIPSVTLLGEKQDWEKLLQKIDKLDKFGDEPQQFAELLRPVVRRFIRSFEDPKGQDVIDFWQRVLNVDNQMSGSTLYSGWITAFCFWDEDGRRMGYLSEGDLSLDEARYYKIDGDMIPSGWVKVPFKIDDDGEKTDAEMIAGSIGILTSASGDLQENGTARADTIQPQTGWWSLEKKTEGGGGGSKKKGESIHEEL